MSYLNYWRMSRSPFSGTLSKAEYFVRGSIEEATARAEFLISHERRLGIVVGPNGCGKSTLLNYLKSRRSQVATRSFVDVDFQGATPNLLAERIRDSLLGEPSPETWLNLSRFNDRQSLGRLIHEIDDLLVSAAAVGRHCVLLMDNAGDSTEETLETLGMLLKRPGRWTAILSIGESLLVELPRKILEACELRIDLPAWELGLTADYFEHVLSRTTQREDVFTAQAITRIHELCDGIARRIAQLADLALVAGAVRRLQTIDADLVDHVFEEFSISLGSGGLNAKFQTM